MSVHSVGGCQCQTLHRGCGLDFRIDHHPLRSPPTVHSQTKIWKKFTVSALW
jgi:hypothetical protein